jgi:hypothetical protein
MKNIYDVIKQKELELARLQKELETLRFAARLLNDDVASAVEAPQAPAMAIPGTGQPRPMAAAKERTPGWAETGLRQFP